MPEVGATAVAAILPLRGQRLQLLERDRARCLVTPCAILLPRGDAVTPAFQGQRVPHAVGRGRVRVRPRVLVDEAVASEDEAEPVVEVGAIRLAGAHVACEAPALALPLVVRPPRTEVHALGDQLRCRKPMDLGDVESPRASRSAEYSVTISFIKYQITPSKFPVLTWPRGYLPISPTAVARYM
eukprot:CAMPEP_0176337170 /NCGR_PEP_ID=MMETSP0121_2-20121125/79493_1 /TAXON_ID=160619 /ORGANISM="Kryptoperidinium foliaceum, Strain CCMP 1326" /LENGTH=183 /DNA_ID=CAMNT_0017680169 /DNA_START=309 /DNA_END=861 /DNA_ORIENTATION=+